MPPTRSKARVSVLVPAKNEAENRIHLIEKTMKEAGDKISEADKAPINAAIQKVKDAIGRNDLSALKAATGELAATSSAMAQHLYAKAHHAQFLDQFAEIAVIALG